jgi:pentatricopeptide repeat protein
VHLPRKLAHPRNAPFVQIAITLWEDMGRRGIPRDVFITNVMLSTLVRSRDYHAALELFEEVQERGLDGLDSLDVFTYSTIIDACARGGIGLDRALGFFRQVGSGHAFVRSFVRPSTFGRP